MTTKEMRRKYSPSDKVIDLVSIILTLACALVVGVIIAPIVSFFFGAELGLVALVASIILVTAIIYVVAAYKTLKVPENHIWVIEFFGKFLVAWAPGPHMCFPFFDPIELREEIFLGEQEEKLFPDKTKLVDLDDASVNVDATLFYKVVDPLVAVYNVVNYRISTRDRVAGLLRAHLGKKSLDEANEAKHEMDLDIIICGQRNSDWKKENFYLEILQDWGVDIRKLAVGDFDLAPEDIEQRRRKQTNEINLDTAENDKKIKVIASEAEAEAIENISNAEKIALTNEGLGMQAQIKALVNAGMTKEAATTFISERYKWSKIGDKALIIDSASNSTAGVGAVLGAGMAKGQNSTSV